MSLGTGKPKAPTQAQLDAVHDGLARAGDLTPGWITHAQLAYMLAMNERTVRLCGRELVRLGIPLVTDSRRGWKIERDPAKVREAAGKLRHRGVAIIERASALEGWASAEEERRAGQGQQSLWDLQPQEIGG